MFIYGLFNDAVNRSDYVTSNGRFTDELSIGKDAEQNGRNLMRYYPGNSPQKLMKVISNRIHDSQTLR